MCNIQQAMSIVGPQNGEPRKTNFSKYDRGGRLFIVKGVMKLSNWEKQNTGHAKK